MLSGTPPHGRSRSDDYPVNMYRHASPELGYTRMWSIHPAQIQPIVDAIAPSVAEVDEAIAILLATLAAHWTPIRHAQRGQDQLHNRA